MSNAAVRKHLAVPPVEWAGAGIELTACSEGREAGHSFHPGSDAGRRRRQSAGISRRGMPRFARAVAVQAWLYCQVREQTVREQTRWLGNASGRNILRPGRLCCGLVRASRPPTRREAMRLSLRRASHGGRARPWSWPASAGTSSCVALATGGFPRLAEQFIVGLELSVMMRGRPEPGRFASAPCAHRAKRSSAPGSLPFGA